MTELGLQTIPGYVVHERIETSAVDATYLASRVSDGYPVVLQVLTEEFSSAAATTTLRTAIDHVSAVRHPVIPTIWDIGETGGRLYTISNALEGRSLAATLATQRQLPHDDMLAVCTELADALEALASAGIVHGAINPRNVWINDRERSPSAPYVSLRGFGTTPLLAHSIRAQRESPPPLDILYVAPEQIAGHQATERTDQYALACLTLHGLTGDPLFDAPTVDALFAAHRSQTPDDARLQADALPQRLVDGLRRALAKDPADRFDSSTAFATAIGGTGYRSWSWMTEEAATVQVTAPGHVPPREIDVRDDVSSRTHAADDRPVRDSAPPPHPPVDEGGATPTDDQPVTARALADADWLPTSKRTGSQHPDTRPSTAPQAADPTRAPELFPGPWRRWAGAALVFIAFAAAGAAITPALLSTSSTTSSDGIAGRPAGTTMREIEATWRHPIADAPVTQLIAADEELVGATRDQVISVDQETGLRRWTTMVDAAVTDLAVMGPTVIARTGDTFSGLDRGSGELRWRSTAADVPDVAAFVTGRGRMFAAGRSPEGRLQIHAVDPVTGEVGWSVDAPAGTTGREPVGMAYDGSERGGRTLYVTAGDQLYAFNTITRELRWQVAIDGPRAASLTAVAGAVLVIDGGGRLCRYDAGDGAQAWSACAPLERTRAPASVVQVRNSRVVVASEHEIMAVDFTSGEPQWRIVSTDELQPAMASNRAATFLAAPDGTIEALAQHNGASLWESAPFGEINAMTANDTAVFVSTGDGRLTRLEASTDAG